MQEVGLLLLKLSHKLKAISHVLKHGELHLKTTVVRVLPEVIGKEPLLVMRL